MKKAWLVICILGLGNLAWAQTAPPLGAAKNFAVLANTTVTNTGATVVTGDVGVSPGTAIKGFNPSGKVFLGTTHGGDPAAAAAQADASTAYGALVAETCGT